MNYQFEKKMVESNGNCEGCWQQDCSPVWNRYSDLMLCGSCYASASKEEDEDFVNNWSDGDVV